ncbi:hypothetical protein [Saccharothrix lopnurensis]|uniref:Excreted virulence factor EspC (Type VII ESX diderm) n=1 Tax=Saccharothrix lopnurensis TaxID=1670621 RepID=A0ABW1P449_9PSEU
MADLFHGLMGVTGAISQFSTAVTGGFTIDEGAGGALIRSIQEISYDLKEELQKTDRLKQEPPLGTTPAAQVYKPFLASIAGDPVQGGAVVLAKLLEELERLRGLVERAVADYQAAEREKTQQLNKQASHLSPTDYTR